MPEAERLRKQGGVWMIRSCQRAADQPTLPSFDTPAAKDRSPPPWPGNRSGGPCHRRRRPSWSGRTRRRRSPPGSRCSTGRLRSGINGRRRDRPGRCRRTDADRGRADEAVRPDAAPGQIHPETAPGRGQTTRRRGIARSRQGPLQRLPARDRWDTRRRPKASRDRSPAVSTPSLNLTVATAPARRPLLVLQDVRRSARSQCGAIGSSRIRRRSSPNAAAVSSGTIIRSG